MSGYISVIRKNKNVRFFYIILLFSKHNYIHIYHFYIFTVGCGVFFFIFFIKLNSISVGQGISKPFFKKKNIDLGSCEKNGRVIKTPDKGRPLRKRERFFPTAMKLEGGGC